MKTRTVHFHLLNNGSDLALHDIADATEDLGAVTEQLFEAAAGRFLEATSGLPERKLVFGSRCVGGIRQWVMCDVAANDTRSFGITYARDDVNLINLRLLNTMLGQKLETKEQKFKFSRDAHHALLDSINARMAPTCGPTLAIIFALQLLKELAIMASEVVVVDDPDTGHPGGRAFYFFVEAAEFDESSGIVILDFPGRLMELVRDHNWEIAKASLPGAYPQWTNGTDDTIEVKITGVKKDSALFPKNQKPHVFDEITGVDRDSMEIYVAAVLRWYEHYDLYYGVTGWKYEVKWKEKKAK